MAKPAKQDFWAELWADVILPIGDTTLFFVKIALIGFSYVFVIRLLWKVVPIIWRFVWN